MKKQSIFFLIMVCLFLMRCGGYHSRQYDGPERDKSQISIITSDDQFVTIGGLDGKMINMANVADISNALIWDGRFPRTVSILPGHHAVLPCYQKKAEQTCAEGWIDVETKAGQTYILKHERLKENTKIIQFWIENQDGTERTLHQKLLNL